MLMKNRAYQFWLAGGFFLCFLARTSLTQAQISSDGTLSTDVKTTDNLNFTINSGGRAGGNLFHSFREFSVPTRGSAVFENTSDVQNIISRVTGGSISNIDGLIRANHSASFFLINPNGIIFGPNASLNIGGSFLASTASGLTFADGTFFSATDPEARPLLTISVPTGLQFGETAGIIRNQSQATRFFPDLGEEVAVGLEVLPGKTLALVGGDVLMEGGNLTAAGGRIELGSVAGNSLVSLTPIAAGWALGYESVQNFQDIQLSQEAFAATTGESSGDIQLQGRRIAITGSGVVSINNGLEPGGAITVKASESVEVVNGGEISTGAFSTGAAGDITIETRRLIVRNDSFIDTSSNNDGRGGNLTVDASELVEVSGGDLGFSRLSTQTFDKSGNAGDLRVTTRRLILRDGGQISSSTESSGDGGTVFVDASESVEVSGTAVFGDRVRISGLFATTRRDGTTGNGGVLSINTGRLVVEDGGSISVAAVEGSTGQAGTLDINASESVEVRGIGSTLLAESESPKPAGNLTISTDKLIVRDGAEVSVSSTGEGAAGDLQVTARSIRLDNQGALTAETKAGEGNITLQAQDILLLRNSNITTNATEAASGGDITIEGLDTLAVINSQISASTEDGTAGSVRVNASESVQLSGEGGLTVEATGSGSAGSLTIDTSQLTLNQGASISASTVSGQGGDIALENLDTLEVINSQISASTEDGTAGSVRVNASESVQLVGEGGLEVEATGSGSAGSLTVNTPQLTLNQGTSISASTVSGQGGNIALENLDTLEVINSQISASTEDGTAGSVRVNASESVQLVGEGGLEVEATGSGSAGSLTVDTSQLTLQEGASISASSSPSGQAGNVDITANSLRLNRGSIIAETGVGQGEEGANITLKVSDLLIMGNESLISAKAFDTANGGNIDIDARFVVAIPAEDSDIIASADRGDGGNINIKTQEIFGLQERRATPGNGTNDIDASSEFGFPGIVEITSPNVDPTKELVEFPEDPINVARLIDQKLCAAGQGSEFTVIGRGGLPDSPNQALKPDAAWEDWRIEESSDQALESQQSVPVQKPTSTPEQATSDSEQEKIVEFQGWAINARGNVVLTAEANAVTPKGVLLPPPGCQQLTEKLSSR